MKITGENNEKLKHKIQEKRKGICDSHNFLVCIILKQTPGVCNEMVFSLAREQGLTQSNKADKFCRHATWKG